MKKIRVLLFFCLLLVPACIRKKKIETIPQSTEQVKSSISNVKTELKPVSLIVFSPSLLCKKDSKNEVLCKNRQEVIALIPRLHSKSYLSFAQHMLFLMEYSIQDKILVYKELKKLAHNHQTIHVLDFFIQVLTENESYLVEHPLIDLKTSLVSASPASSEFFKDHPEISDAVWSLAELYKTGNTLLQEAVRLNNYEAVHYLLEQGATPRHLDDPRGLVLTLEWADKYGSQEIARELSSTVNQLSSEHITVLDELLYKDPNAAQLVRKYGGKRAVELT